MVEVNNSTSLPSRSRTATHAIRKIQMTPGVFWVRCGSRIIHHVRKSARCGQASDAAGLIVEEEVDGVVFENGPNAVLLSDVMLQGGSFANLSEFLFQNVLPSRHDPAEPSGQYRT